MKNKIVKSALAALAASIAVAPMATTIAEAKVKAAKFHVIQHKFSDVPYLEMSHDGTKYVWTNQRGFNIQMKIYAKSSRYRIELAKVTFEDTQTKLWAFPKGVKTYKIEKVVNAFVPKNQLSRYANQAAALCDVAGGNQKVIRDLDIAKLRFVVGDTALTRYKTAYNKLPLKVVCQPKSAARETTIALSVTKLRLYTVPAKPRCNQPVKMITEIHTNLPGKVAFNYVRGDGEFRKASVTTTKGGTGYSKRWASTYKFGKSTNRKYMVTLLGHKKSTQWVPLKVDCGAQSQRGKVNGLRS